MACRRLPYYHRFLHRENFSSPLKVVYRKPLREEKGYRSKYQWDLIHDPQSVLFSWLEDEKEGEAKCYGIFDDCEEVLAILAKIRDIRISGKAVVIKKQTDENFRRFTGKNIDIEETEFKKVRIIYKPSKTEDIVFDPLNYYEVFKEQNLYADKDGNGVVEIHNGFVFKNKNNIECFRIIIDDEGDNYQTQKEILKEYLFGAEKVTDPEADKKIIIKINRIKNNNYRTVGTINIDNDAIIGYTLELPKGTDVECQSSCTDEKKIENECTRIIKGSYIFSITSWSNKTEYINKSLRIDEVPGRTGILIHRGVNARIWSNGCILAMRNDPTSDSDNATASQRANSVTDSEDFCVEIVNYINERKAEIMEKYKIDVVEMKLIITEDNEIND